MIKGITYADEKMKTSAILCCTSMLKHGFDSAEPFGPYLISQDFKKDNWQYFYNGPVRGAGYWIWKPRVIWETMQTLQDGDILVYSDAGIEWVNSVRHLIDRMDQDIFFFTNGFPHVEWCKADVINAIIPHHMIDLGSKREVNLLSKHLRQVQASVILFKVNETTRNFVKEWLLWCQMPGFVDDSPSKLPNYPTFAESRHDQSVLTCLQIKYGYKLHFWPTNYSEHIRHTAQPEDNYPTIFSHHRRRDTGHGEGQPEW